VTEIIAIDNGLCNVGSMANMVRKAGGQVRVSADPAQIATAQKLIFPGVGHFGHAMALLRESGLVEVLQDAVIERKIPILGVCLGMQLFSRHSEEGDADGLGWIDARTIRLTPGDPALKVPHMGWNAIQPTRPDPLFSGLDDEARFYFVHSYHVVCNDPADVLARTTHGAPFVCAVRRENIWGVQFHPEKSHRYGLALMKAFVEHVD
jgi:glutamine amidotransferase